ncbi:MAG TPA: DUF2470 domain-containing protein [Pseudonocardiaceae bacterium]|nr:DUF2470 domain-containing protein [Pseudonocardiaceae bacterium]
MPPPAERARTLTTRDATAAVLAAGTSDRSEPALHHVYQDGSAVVLLPDNHPLLAMLELKPRGDVSAMIELTDTAPVALRRPVRGLLWITGWLRALDPQQARQAAMEVVAHRCDERLLDLGYGSRLLYLHPVFAVLSDAEGTAWLAPADLAAAEPDPLRHLEREWLRHLDQTHPHVLHALARHVFAVPHCAHVRPLSVDRLGLRLRIEHGEETHDLRLTFQRPATTPVQLATELHRLTGCPAVTSGLRPPGADRERRA